MIMVTVCPISSADFLSVTQEKGVIAAWYSNSW